MNTGYTLIALIVSNYWGWLLVEYVVDWIRYGAGGLPR